MKDNLYYLLVRDETQGPFTLHQLRSMWNSGALTGMTLFSRPGMTEWKPLLDMQEALESADVPNPVPQTSTQGNSAPPSQPSVASPSGNRPSQPTSKCDPSGASNGPALNQPAVLPSATQASQPTEGQSDETLKGVALIFLIVVLIGLILSNVQPATDGVASRDKDAYSAACNFIRQRYPGAKEFSSFQDSNVRPTYEAGVFQVEVMVTGVNAFGGPVRNRMIVDVKLQNNKWVYQDSMVKN